MFGDAQCLSLLPASRCHNCLRWVGFASSECRAERRVCRRREPQPSETGTVDVDPRRESGGRSGASKRSERSRRPARPAWAGRGIGYSGTVLRVSSARYSHMRRRWVEGRTGARRRAAGTAGRAPPPRGPARRRGRGAGAARAPRGAQHMGAHRARRAGARFKSERLL
jgi:hypothetical protein